MSAWYFFWDVISCSVWNMLKAVTGIFLFSLLWVLLVKYILHFCTDLWHGSAAYKNIAQLADVVSDSEHYQKTKVHFCLSRLCTITLQWGVFKQLYCDFCLCASIPHWKSTICHFYCELFLYLLRLCHLTAEQLNIFLPEMRWCSPWCWCHSFDFHLFDRMFVVQQHKLWLL